MSKVKKVTKHTRANTRGWRSVFPQKRGKRPPAPRLRLKQRTVAKKRGRRAAADDPPVTPPVPNPYQAIADAFGAMLDKVPSLIPFYQPANATLRKAMRAALSVPTAFVASMASRVQSTPALQSLGTFDVADTEDTLQYRPVIRALGERFQGIGDNLVFSADLRYAKKSQGSLQMYYLTKGLGRDLLGDLLGGDIQKLAKSMGLDLGRKGRKKAKGGPAPAPVKPQQ